MALQNWQGWHVGQRLYNALKNGDARIDAYGNPTLVAYDGSEVMLHSLWSRGSVQKNELYLTEYPNPEDWC